MKKILALLLVLSMLFVPSIVLADSQNEEVIEHEHSYSYRFSAKQSSSHTIQIDTKRVLIPMEGALVYIQVPVYKTTTTTWDKDYYGCDCGDYYTGTSNFDTSTRIWDGSY